VTTTFDVDSPHRDVRLASLREAARASLLFLPGVVVAVMAVATLGLLAVDDRLDLRPPFVFTDDAGSARDLLSTVASATLTCRGGRGRRPGPRRLRVLRSGVRALTTRRPQAPPGFFEAGAGSAAGMALDPTVKRFATDGRNFAALTTMRKDGRPSTHVMWVDADDEHLLVNTEVHRAKYHRVQRDPRVAVTIWDEANPYRYVEAIGTVVGEVRGPDARAHIDHLARKYQGVDEYQNPIQSERVILRIAVDQVHRNNV